MKYVLFVYETEAQLEARNVIHAFTKQPFLEGVDN